MERIIFGSDGKPLLAIEVDAVPREIEEQLEALRGGVPATFDGLEEAGVAIAEACKRVLGKVRDNLKGNPPDELELKFGVKVAAEGGLPFVTKASGEATFEVRAVWTGSGSAASS